MHCRSLDSGRAAHPAKRQAGCGLAQPSLGMTAEKGDRSRFVSGHDFRGRRKSRIRVERAFRPASKPFILSSRAGFSPRGICFRTFSAASEGVLPVQKGRALIQSDVAGYTFVEVDIESGGNYAPKCCSSDLSSRGAAREVAAATDRARRGICFLSCCGERADSSMADITPPSRNDNSISVGCQPEVLTEPAPILRRRI